MQVINALYSGLHAVKFQPLSSQSRPYKGKGIIAPNLVSLFLLINSRILTKPGAESSGLYFQSYIHNKTLNRTSF